MRRRNPKIARDGLVALVALVVVVFALLPMSSRAVRPSIHPSSPVVNAVTPQTHAVTPTKVLSATVVRIHRGDTLWAIAERTLRDPMRWREIWRLNRGKVMRTGQRFIDPNLIRPGWVLKIPG